MCDPSSSLSLLLSPARSKTHPSPCATADLFQSHTLSSLGYCISGLTGLPPCNASSSLQPPWLWGHSQFWASQGHSHTCQIKPRLCSMAYHTFWDSASPMPQGTRGLLVGLQIFHALSVLHTRDCCLCPEGAPLLKSSCLIHPSFICLVQVQNTTDWVVQKTDFYFFTVLKAKIYNQDVNKFNLPWEPSSCLGTAAFSSDFTQHFLCVCMGRELPSNSVSSYKDTNPIGLGPYPNEPHLTSFNNIWT